MKTEVEVQQSHSTGELMLCPNCGQKLAAVEWLSGDAVLCIKCRRCKEFIRIRLES